MERWNPEMDDVESIDAAELEAARVRLAAFISRENVAALRAALEADPQRRTGLIHQQAARLAADYARERDGRMAELERLRAVLAHVEGLFAEKMSPERLRAEQIWSGILEALQATGEVVDSVIFGYVKPPAAKASRVSPQSYVEGLRKRLDSDDLTFLYPRGNGNRETLFLPVGTEREIPRWQDVVYYDPELAKQRLNELEAQLSHGAAEVDEATVQALRAEWDHEVLGPYRENVGFAEAALLPERTVASFHEAAAQDYEARAQRSPVPHLHAWNGFSEQNNHAHPEVRRQSELDGRFFGPLAITFPYRFYSKDARLTDLDTQDRTEHFIIDRDHVSGNIVLKPSAGGFFSAMEVLDGDPFTGEERYRLWLNHRGQTLAWTLTLGLNRPERIPAPVVYISNHELDVHHTVDYGDGSQCRTGF